MESDIVIGSMHPYSTCDSLHGADTEWRWFGAQAYVPIMFAIFTVQS